MTTLKTSFNRETSWFEAPVRRKPRFLHFHRTIYSQDLTSGTLYASLLIILPTQNSSQFALAKRSRTATCGTRKSCKFRFYALRFFAPFSQFTIRSPLLS